MIKMVEKKEKKKTEKEKREKAKPLASLSRLGQTKVAKAKNEKVEGEKSPKTRTSDRSVMIKELKAKAKKLAAGIEGGVETEEIKEELKKKRELLIPLDDYTKTGIHLGTKVITPDMKKFVYRRRADSIGVLNTSLIDEHIKKAISLIVKFKPEEIILSCKREAGWPAAEMFGEATGIKVFTKKYPAGMMTNTKLEEFYEPELIIGCDPWIDRNALNNAVQTNKKIILLCDTNNFTKNAEVVIPCNNKSAKSLALIFWLLARGYRDKVKVKGEFGSMNSFVGDDGQEIYGV